MTWCGSGKVRHVGLSDVPAWYAGRAQAIAELRGYEPVSALQLEYSLAERAIENEFVPFGTRHGAGIMVWSPLASGLLSGKYRPAQAGNAGRLDGFRNSTHPGFQKFTERNWAIVAELEKVASELGRSMPQVALNWVATQPGIATVILGATTLSQIGQSWRAGLRDSGRASRPAGFGQRNPGAVPLFLFRAADTGARHRRRCNRRQALRLRIAGACRGRAGQRVHRLIDPAGLPPIAGRAPRDIAAPFVYRNSASCQCSGRGACARAASPGVTTCKMTRTR